MEEIVVGDEVVTLNGRGHRVTKVDRTVLTAARGYVWISCNGRVVKLTDDHDLWVSHDDTEGWGTHNYNWWSYDAEKEGTLDVPAIPLQPYRYYDFAILEGWAPCMAEYVQGNPNDVVYGLELDGGGGFIAEGFVVIADRCRPEDIEGVEWNGV